VSAWCWRDEADHESAVGSSGGGEFTVALFELEPQIEDLLFEGDDAGAVAQWRFDQAVGAQQAKIDD
jgi:hypothetical protein